MCVFLKRPCPSTLGVRNNRRSLGEVFGCILWRCGRCLELSVTSRSSQAGRKAARGVQIFARNAGIVGAFPLCLAHIWGRKYPEPLYPGAHWLSPRNRGLRDGQGFVYCQDDQSVTAGDRCIITPPPPFFFFLFLPFLAAWLCPKVREIKPSLLSRLPS